MERFGAFWRSSTAALSERDFRLLWIGQTGSYLGDALVGVALAFAVLELTGSAADLGLVFAAFALPRVLFTLAGGVWSDRLPRQRVMVACDLVRAGAQAVMSTLLITGNAEIWQLMAFAVVMGSAAAFFMPASIGLMPQIVGAKRLQEANALMSISQSATHIFGPLLSGLIVATIGAGWAFAIDGSVSVSARSAIGRTSTPAGIRSRSMLVPTMCQSPTLIASTPPARSASIATSTSSVICRRPRA